LRDLSCVALTSAMRSLPEAVSATSTTAPRGRWRKRTVLVLPAGTSIDTCTVAAAQGGAAPASTAAQASA